KAKRDTPEAKKAADEAKVNIERVHDEEIRSTYAETTRAFAVVERIHGRGLFQAFFEYQNFQIHAITGGVLTGTWLPGTAGDGVFLSTAKFFFVGPSWALRHHTVYFLVFGAMFLIIWSLFGGAIARIAAVHVADEGRKLSVRQGLSFAISKFLSFLSAPMIPLII